MGHSEGWDGRIVQLTSLPAQASNNICGARTQVINSDAEQLYTLLVCEGLPEGPHCRHPLLRWQQNLSAILLQNMSGSLFRSPLHSPVPGHWADAALKEFRKASMKGFTFWKASGMQQELTRNCRKKHLETNGKLCAQLQTADGECRGQHLMAVWPAYVAPFALLPLSALPLTASLALFQASHSWPSGPGCYRVAGCCCCCCLSLTRRED